MNRSTPLSILFRLIIGGVLIYAGFIKAIRPTAEFAAMIATYRVMPSAVIPLLALAIPYLEMWLGLFLVFGLFARKTPLVACGMFGVFLLVVLQALLRGIDLSACGCFGPDSLSPRITLIIDAALITLSYILYRMNKYPQALTLDDLLS